MINEYSEGRNNNEGSTECDILREQIEINSLIGENLNQRNSAIKNQGYISNNKNKECIRLLSLNPRGYGPDAGKKLQ